MQFQQLYSHYYTQIEVQQLYKNLKAFGFNKVELYSNKNVVAIYLMLEEGLMKISDNFVHPVVPQPSFDVQNKSIFNNSGLEIFSSSNYNRGYADIIEHTIYKQDLLLEHQKYDHYWNTLHGVNYEKTVYAYDANKKLISETKTASSTTSSFARNDNGTFISEKDPESNATTIEVKKYEYKGNTVYKIDDFGNSTAIYNELKTPGSWSREYLDKNNQPEGIRTLIFDDAGRVIHIQQNILARPKDNKQGRLVERHRNTAKDKYREAFVYEKKLPVRKIDYFNGEYNDTVEYRYKKFES